MAACVFVALICVGSLGVARVLSSDDEEACEDPPVFSPSHLVVRHGDPTSATCTVCKEKCRNKLIGLETPLGTSSKNGTTITWKVDQMSEWDLSLLCYYNTASEQCFSSLPITVYQHPAKVSFSFVDHSGPMFVGHTYTMQCLVEDVAPVGGVTVIFYKGETELAQLKLDGTEKKPTTKAAQLEYRPAREYRDWSYRCAAQLQLGTEHHSRWNAGEAYVATHFPPQLEVPSRPDPVFVTEGDAFSLNCSAHGSPLTSYWWTLPSGQIITNGSVLAVNPVSAADEGRYSCFAHNYLGNDTVDYSVFVQRVATTTTPTTTTPTTTTATTTTATTTPRVLDSTTTRTTGSTGRTAVPRLTLCFMLVFLAVV